MNIVFIDLNRCGEVVSRMSKTNSSDSDDNHENQIETTASDPGLSKSRLPPSKPLKTRFYIDELGFYRHLDPEQKQYVCSNISSIRNPGEFNGNRGPNTQNDRRILNSNASNSGDGGFEVCFRAIRLDLGISHFDRTEDYDDWKRSWDQFMRVKLLSQQPVTLNSELKRRIRSGIPHDYRCKVWTALIRMRTKNIRAQFGEDIYDAIIRDFIYKVEVPNHDTSDQNNNLKKDSNLLDKPITTRRPNDLIPIDSNESASTSARGPFYVSPKPFTQEAMIDKCFKQIELDLLRTLPNNRHFEDPKSRGTQRVRRVLRAFACFNQSVGYCQGMNRLAAMALLVLPEEEAFWCLVAIIQCIMPRDYYLKPWLAQVDCCVLNDLLEKKMPKLHRHLVSNDIQLTLFTWFFTIFVDGFRPELMLRIWDCFLLEGDKILFRFALAILNIAHDDLLGINDFSAMSVHLNRLVSTRKLDMERLFEIAFESMNPLSIGFIQARRDFHKNRLMSMMDD